MRSTRTVHTEICCRAIQALKIDTLIMGIAVVETIRATFFREAFMPREKRVPLNDCHGAHGRLQVIKQKRGESRVALSLGCGSVRYL